MRMYIIMVAFAWIGGGAFFMNCLANDAAARGNTVVGEFLAAIRRFDPAALTVAVAFMAFWPLVLAAAHLGKLRRA